MKKAIRKALSILLVAVMLVSSAPLAGFVGLELPDWLDFSKLFAVEAEAATYSGTCGDNLTWTLDSSTGVLEISGIGAMKNYSSSKAPWYLNRSYIKTVKIGNGVTSIGSYAFYWCESLTSITIGNSVTSIGSYAFYWCYSLTSITIPNSVKSIGDGAFYDCDNLTSITIPDSVTSIGDYAFAHCTSLTSITIPDSVTSICDRAFYGCDSLTSITIPDSVTSIGDSAFAHCASLTNITIPDSVTSIGDSAFYDCTSLTSITIPDSVTSIGDWAFAYCTSLTSITIPDSVTSIGDWAFAYCTSLTSITIPDSVTSIGVCAFEYCYSLTSITVDKNNKNYSSDASGVLFNKNKTQLIQYPIGNTRTSYEIPDSVTSIDVCAFEYCYSLTSITVDKNNKNYSSDASGVLFNKNKTQLIQYPIGNTRTSYEIPDSVTSIGDRAFKYCDSLTSITIPDNVKSIGEWAFAYCRSLTSITIPDSVTSIGDSAFYYCDCLTDVYYAGSENEWKAIVVGNQNSCLTSATIHFNSSGNNENDDPVIEPDGNYFYTLHGFSSEPTLHLGKADSIDMQFEIEAFDGVNPAFLVSNPAFSFTSSDTNVFQIDNIAKSGNSTSIEILSENAGVAILTVTAYVDGEYVAGGQYRVTVEGETVYHAKNVPVRDDFNFISNEIIVDNFNFEDHGTGYCTISFDAYNQANCIGSVDVYDKDGNLIFSKAIGAFTGNIPTGLWNTVKQLYEIFTEDFYRDRSYKEEKYSKKTEISISQIPIDGYISISNDVNSSMPCALYNLSKLFVKISSEILGGFFKKAPSEEVIDEAAESLALEVLAEVIKSPVDAGTIFDILEEFCLALSHGSSSEKMDMVVDDYILFVDSLNIDVGDILLEAAKGAGIGVVEGLVYKSLGIPGTLIKTSFKMFSLSKTAEHIEILNEFVDSGKTSIYVSSAYDSTLYSNGYYVYDRELFGENVTFHQYAITSGNDYLDSIGVFRNMEYINVIGMDLYQNGKKVQPTGTVEVAIPVPEGMSFSEILNIRVYRKEADGTFTKLECDFRNYESGYLYIKTDHFSVYCIVAEEISNITDITFSETELTIRPDEYIINKPILSPSNTINEKLVWSSSNESVAMVTTSGYAIGVTPGEATITVSTEDGEASASYKVSVIDLSMEIRIPSTTKINYGDSIVLHADVELPSGYYVEWTASNGNFEWTSDAKTCTITPSKSGDTVFTATVYDAEGNEICKDEQTMTAKIGFFDKFVTFFKNIFLSILTALTDFFNFLNDIL